MLTCVCVQVCNTLVSASTAKVHHHPSPEFFLTAECGLMSTNRSVLVRYQTQNEAMGQIWRKCPQRALSCIFGLWSMQA